MIGVHVAFTIPTEVTDMFLGWKAAEGVPQRKTPGFIKRSLHRSVEEPNHFYYISYWDTQEQMEAFGAGPEFAAAFKECGAVAGAWSGDLCHVTEVFDDVSEVPGYTADGREMIGIHVEFVNKPGTEDGLLRWKALEGTEQRKTPGFLKRSLHRNVEQPNIFYYVSYWETVEQMNTFGSSEWFKAAGKSIGRAPGDATVTLFHTTEVFNEVSELTGANV